MKSERGQILIYIILFLIGSVGFVLLAFDGGRVYAERRRMQSAADTAAFAAAYAASKNQDYISAALTKARLNQFDDSDEAYNPGKQPDVQVYNPPADGMFSPENIKPGLDANDYYQVKIRSRVNQVFSTFINRAPLEIQVEAVAHLLPEQPISGNHAIVASSPNGCKGVWFHGDGKTVVSGGNVFSNSDRRGMIDNCDAVVKDGTGGVNVLDGGIYTVGSFLDSEVGIVSTSEGILEGADPLTQLEIPVPDCPALLPKQAYAGGSADLQPGYYPDGIVVTDLNARLTLSPGVYCLDEDFSMSGGELTGQGVLFILRNGAFQINGSTQVKLSARTNDDPDSEFSGIEWEGMLLYMPADNDQPVYIGGGSESIYSGTIYAPGPPAVEGADKCTIEGSGASLDVKSSINCYNVKIVGSSSVTIEYQSEDNFHLPPQVKLIK